VSHGIECQTVRTADGVPYLDRPLLPLAIALPLMLEQVETGLAAATPAKKLRLAQRAELIRGRLARQGPSSIPP
jgi:hypothetical protein